MQLKIDFCSKCGKKLAPGSNICMECGKKVEPIGNFNNQTIVDNPSKLNSNIKSVNDFNMNEIKTNDVKFNPLVGLIIVLFPILSVIFYFHYKKLSIKVAAQSTLLGAITLFIINSILLYYVILLNG